MPNQSCYVVDFSVLPGAARHAEGHAYPTLAAIYSWLARMLIGGPDDEIDGFALSLLVGGAPLGLWVVQRGKFERDSAWPTPSSPWCCDSYARELPARDGALLSDRTRLLPLLRRSGPAIDAVKELAARRLHEA